MNKTVTIPLKEYHEFLAYKASYLNDYLIYSTGKTIISKSRDEVIEELIKENKRLEIMTFDLNNKLCDFEIKIIKLKNKLNSIPNWIKKLIDWYNNF